MWNSERIQPRIRRISRIGIEDWVIERLSRPTITTSWSRDWHKVDLPFVRFVLFVVNMHSIAASRWCHRPCSLRLAVPSRASPIEPFDREWGTLFDVDNTLATALIDRLMHHGEGIVIQRDSYRLKDKGSDSTDA
jgi:IstB-like ATP binding protein